MPHKNRQLSINETTALNLIAKHPGLTPAEIGAHFPEDMSPTSASAITSRLTYLRCVNRVKVKGAASYRYYSLTAPLPEGYTEWNNTLVKVKRWKKGNGEVPPKEAIDTLTHDLFTPEPPSDKVSLPNVLIVLPLAEKETITVTIEQARVIWVQLNSIFAK